MHRKVRRRIHRMTAHLCQNGPGVAHRKFGLGGRMTGGHESGKRHMPIVNGNGLREMGIFDMAKIHFSGVESSDSRRGGARHSSLHF